MITVSILYPKNEGGTFDLKYYLETHMPMTLEKLGAALRGVRVEHGLSGAPLGAAPAYVAMCHLDFDSLEAFQEAFTPHAAVLQGDIANYTNVSPLIQINEVKISQ